MITQCKRVFAAILVFLTACLFLLFFNSRRYSDTVLTNIPTEVTRLSSQTGNITNIVSTNATNIKKISVENVTNCLEKKVKLSPHSLPITGLVSFPGAGNTWSRHLIQQMSGLGTSSCYCDGGLRNKGFPFECHTDKSKTLVVKTHETKHYTQYKFKKVVLLIRNPYDALLAYANYAKGGHTGRPSKPLLIQAAQTMFDHSLRWYTNLTNRTIEGFSGPVFVLQYELLKTNMADTLTQLADFLNVNITETDIACTIKLQEGNFHRKVSEAEHMAELKQVYSKEQFLKMKQAADYTETMLKTAYNIDLDIGWSPLERLLFNQDS